MDKFDNCFTTLKYFFRPLNTFGSGVDNFRFSSTNHKTLLLTPLVRRVNKD